MQDFPANSQKPKQTDKQDPIKPVTSAEPVRRKEGLGHKFRATFFGGSGRDALGYMGEEVVVPAIREMIYESLHAGLQRVIFGGDTHRASRYGAPSASPNTRVAYDSISKPTQASRGLSPQARARFDFQDLVIPSRDEANEVIDQMYEILSRNGEVTVADLYTLTGIRPDHTDMKWGWINLRGTNSVKYGKKGWLLTLPRPTELR
jgi:hypothetical protein